MLIASLLFFPRPRSVSTIFLLAISRECPLDLLYHSQ